MRLGIQASERAKECHWRSYLCHCSQGSQIGLDDGGDDFVDCIDYSRMVRFRTGVLHLPSNTVDQIRDDEVHVLLRSTVEKEALRDTIRSIIRNLS